MSFFKSIGKFLGTTLGVAVGGPAGGILGGKLGGGLGDLAGDRYQAGRNRKDTYDNILSQFAAYSEAGLTPQEAAGSVGNAGAVSGPNQRLAAQTQTDIADKQIALGQRQQDIQAATSLSIAKLQAETQRENVQAQVAVSQQQADTAGGRLELDREVAISKLAGQIESQRLDNLNKDQRWLSVMKIASMGSENLIVTGTAAAMSKKFGINFLTGEGFDKLPVNTQREIVLQLLALQSHSAREAAGGLSIASDTLKGGDIWVDRIRRWLLGGKPATGDTGAPVRPVRTQRIFYPTSHPQRRGYPG